MTDLHDFATDLDFDAIRDPEASVIDLDASVGVDAHVVDSYIPVGLERELQDIVDGMMNTP